MENNGVSFTENAFVLQTVRLEGIQYVKQRHWMDSTNAVMKTGTVRTFHFAVLYLYTVCSVLYVVMQIQ